jgi:hypothetical protein
LLYGQILELDRQVLAWHRHGTRRPWLLRPLQRRTAKIAAVAMTNKMPRIAQVLMARGGEYREPAAQTA